MHKNMTTNLKQLKERIEALNQHHQIQILTIVTQSKVAHTENKNGSFVNLTNTGTYSNTTNATLTIANNSVAVSGSIYRVQLSAAGVTANTVSSNAILTIV